MTDPSDEQLLELMPQQMRDDLAAYRIILNRHAVDHARAAIARWGRPTPQPVAASERLPGPQDCTAQGWCWVFYKGFATWTLEPPLGQDGKHTGYTHWLPADALPIPEATHD